MAIKTGKTGEKIKKRPSIQVEGLEHTIHFTPEIGGKSEKDLGFMGFATIPSIAQAEWKSKKNGEKIR